MNMIFKSNVKFPKAQTMGLVSINNLILTFTYSMAQQPLNGFDRPLIRILEAERWISPSPHEYL